MNHKEVRTVKHKNKNPLFYISSYFSRCTHIIIKTSVGFCLDNHFFIHGRGTRAFWSNC